MQINENNSDVKLCNVSSFRVGIVAARFNREITDALLVSAEEELQANGVQKSNIKVVSVPGSVEIPSALQMLAERKDYDCLIALGAVIKGETPHFDYVCKIASEGVLRVMLDYKIPVGFGVITTLNVQQAKERIGSGKSAVRAALELACMKKRS